jgi:hypothetical protein
MQFFDLLEKEPAPQLEISLNSNLGVTTAKIDRLFDRIQSLLDQKKIRKFSLFTSIEGWGDQAEYMRTGLKCPHWERNFTQAIERGFKVNIMCTFNVLCVATFDNFLSRVMYWRKKYGKEALAFDTPYLKEPPHWMLNILPKEFNWYMDEHLKMMNANKDYFTSVEIAKMQRVRDYMYQNPVDEKKIQQGRRDFYSFFKENDKRLGTDLLKTFPQYKEFYEHCKGVFEQWK